ncbi:MAG: methylthioribulose 1-phosphate dehydratase [Gammaproteobacteria bacterium]|nr:methylthioribulose 1-phosphate dehydratase [Gammaproteobacteria bacterium]
MSADLQKILLSSDFQQQRLELIETGHFLYKQGWMPATSGNFSVRLNDGHIAITASGRHKGKLSVEDITVVDSNGQALDNATPSGETVLHTTLYKHASDIGAVLHSHSVNATLLSTLCRDELILQGYELLKAFPGIDSAECNITVPVFDNVQDLSQLATQVNDYLDTHSPVFGYLITGHGLFTWGASINDALHHIEAFEFLFECEMRKMQLQAEKNNSNKN